MANDSFITIFLGGLGGSLATIIIQIIISKINNKKTRKNIKEQIAREIKLNKANLQNILEDRIIVIRRCANHKNFSQWVGFSSFFDNRFAIIVNGLITYGRFYEFFDDEDSIKIQKMLNFTNPDHHNNLNSVIDFYIKESNLFKLEELIDSFEKEIKNLINNLNEVNEKLTKN
jgi:valyl-tRNA synthetase